VSFHRVSVKAFHVVSPWPARLPEQIAGLCGCLFALGVIFQVVSSCFKLFLLLCKTREFAAL
jgi:hypothetical protein